MCEFDEGVVFAECLVECIVACLCVKVYAVYIAVII